MKRALFLAIASLLIVPCAGGYYYNFSLLGVQRQGNTSEKSGTVTSVKVVDTTTTKYKITDSLVDVVLSISTYYIEFTVKNKTGNTISIPGKRPHMLTLEANAKG